MLKQLKSGSSVSFYKFISILKTESCLHWNLWIFFFLIVSGFCSLAVFVFQLKSCAWDSREGAPAALCLPASLWCFAKSGHAITTPKSTSGVAVIHEGWSASHISLNASASTSTFIARKGSKSGFEDSLKVFCAETGQTYPPLTIVLGVSRTTQGDRAELGTELLLHALPFLCPSILWPNWKEKQSRRGLATSTLFGFDRLQCVQSEVFQSRTSKQCFVVLKLLKLFGMSTVIE